MLPCGVSVYTSVVALGGSGILLVLHWAKG